jgi:hypothetical protein
MGRNRLVYGENTEISYLVKLLTGMLFICIGVGTLLVLLNQLAFGGIGFASALLILIIILSERRKQYQKVDGSFLYNDKEVSIHVDIYGKMRTKRPVVLKYGDVEVEMISSEGGKYAKSLTFMLDENTPCVFVINRKKMEVTVTIAGQMIVDNNYVRKEYLLPE